MRRASLVALVATTALLCSLPIAGAESPSPDDAVSASKKRVKEKKGNKGPVVKRCGPGQITAVVNFHRACLQPDKRCNPKRNSDYLDYELFCTRRVDLGSGKGSFGLRRPSLGRLRGRQPIYINDKGVIPKAAALQAFVKVFAPLPGVRKKPGAVGAVDGPVALNAIRFHRRSLTAAQRRVVEAVAGGRAIDGREVRDAEASATDQTYSDAKVKKIAYEEMAKVLAFMKGHFKPLSQEVTVEYTGDGFSVGKQILLKLAGVNREPYELAQSLYRIPGECEIEHGEKFQKFPEATARAMLAHEAFHCLHYEYFRNAGGTFAEWNEIPPFIREGFAEFAAASTRKDNPPNPISGLPWYHSPSKWRGYITEPTKPVQTRSYDGLGYWAGIGRYVDPISAFIGSTKPGMTVAGRISAATTASGLDAERNALDHLGVSYFRDSSLGPDWEIYGPHAPPAGAAQAKIPSAKLDSSSEPRIVTAQRGATAQAEILLEANFFRIETTAPGDLVNGRIEFPDRAEEQIEESVLTTLEKCPDGSDIPLRKVNRGLMRVGIAGYPPSTSHVEVRFVPVPDDEYCKDPGQPGPAPSANCEVPKKFKGKTAACNISLYQGHFYARAEGNDIQCHISDNTLAPGGGTALYVHILGTQTDVNGNVIGPDLTVATIVIPKGLKAIKNGKQIKHEFDDVSPAWSSPPSGDGRARWDQPDPDRPWAAFNVRGSNEGGRLQWDGERSGSFAFSASDKHVGRGGFMADNTGFARGRFHCKTITKDAVVAPEGQ